MTIPKGKSLIEANSTTRRNGKAAKGMMLMDCLVYLAMFFVIVALAFNVFYTCWDNSRNLRRAADEIAGTLKAGERWRAEVRNASAALQTENSDAGQILRIPQKSGEVDYRFFDDAVWRRNGASGEWTKVLPKIKASRMGADQRREVTAWKWEVELVTRRKGAHIVPLFTFEAVPQPQELQ
jgi:hypothetical protein